MTLILKCLTVREVWTSSLVWKCIKLLCIWSSPLCSFHQLGKNISLLSHNIGNATLGILLVELFYKKIFENAKESFGQRILRQQFIKIQSGLDIFCNEVKWQFHSCASSDETENTSIFFSVSSLLGLDRRLKTFSPPGSIFKDPTWGLQKQRQNLKIFLQTKLFLSNPLLPILEVPVSTS